MTKDSPHCVKCTHYAYCDEKRMVACAYVSTPRYAEKANQSASQSCSNEIQAKHDYRTIKISHNQNTTIDLEQFKKDLAQSHFNHINNCFFKNGS